MLVTLRGQMVDNIITPKNMQIWKLFHMNIDIKNIQMVTSYLTQTMTYNFIKSIR